MNIQEIHDKVFDFLRNQYPDLRFVLRTTNKYGRLNKGYWFMGGENYLCVSFWDIKDTSNMTPKIYFRIEDNGNTKLFLVDKDGLKANETKRTDFFELIAPSLKMNRVMQKGETRNVWIREFSYGDKKNYLEALNDFIKNEKITIDTLITASKLKDFFPEVMKEEFDKKVNRVIEYRKELFNQTTAVITKEIEKDYIVLNRLELSNIGHFEELELDLSKRIICLIGENGSGKSTILQSLVLGLTTLRDSDYIKENNDRLQNLIQIQSAERNVIEHSPKGKIVIYYNEKYKNILTFSKEESGVNDNGIQYSEYIDIDDSESDFKNFKNTNNPADNYFKSLIKSFSQVKSVLNGQKEITNSVKEPNFSDVTDLLYNQPDKSFENIRTWILKSIDIETPSSERLKMREVVVKIFEVISKITRFKVSLAPFELGQEEVFIQTNDAPNGIPIRLMSQGYNNVIGWVGDFMKRLWEVTPEKDNFIETHAICVIDEIDTYLHPKWQRTILNVLAKEFKNTQFIITTHSPLIISNLLKDESAIYSIKKEQDKGFKAYQDKDFNPYGADTNRILDLTMDVDERPLEVEILLKDFFDNIDSNNFDEALIKSKHLKTIIDPYDPEIIRGETIIETRKMLQEL